MGKKKTFLVFVVYFLIIGLMALPDILNFDFDNRKSFEEISEKSIIHIDKDNYFDRRDNALRVSKAAIDKFWINEKQMELFISFYKEDLYTIKNLNESPGALKDLKVRSDSININLKSLFHIYIDDKKLSYQKWYQTEHAKTNQEGIITKFSLDSLKSGYHELKINKIFWVDKKKKIDFIENWAIIPFEFERNAN